MSSEKSGGYPTEQPPPYAPPPYPGAGEPSAVGGYGGQQPGMPGFKPPSAGYPDLSGAQTSGQQQAPVVVVQTTVMVAPSSTPYPLRMVCTNCRADITTSTKPEAGVLTWLVSGGLCLLGCWMGCCLIPFCVDGLQDVEHFCPNCKKHLGTFKRM